VPKDIARYRVRRIKERGRYDAPTIHGILDAGWLAHVSFANDGQPFVIPMLYVRDGGDILLHGSIASRLQKTLGEGVDACVCVTHVDGLVLARSHFHHSVNYRSVVAFGRAKPVLDAQEKADALLRFVEGMLPGRGVEARAADRKELAATSVLRFEIVDASAKIRAGVAKDDADDIALPHWAGVVPVRPHYGVPEASEDVPASVALPPSVRRLTGALDRDEAA